MESPRAYSKVKAKDRASRLKSPAMVARVAALLALLVATAFANADAGNPPDKPPPVYPIPSSCNFVDADTTAPGLRFALLRPLLSPRPPSAL